MKWPPPIFEGTGRGYRCATVDDIKKAFADYHEALHWVAAFLVGDNNLATACVVDACSIAETQTEIFHEWLVQWAGRATVRCALQTRKEVIAKLAPLYEGREPVHDEHPPLSAKYCEVLFENADDFRTRLDVLCRFVLVMRGIGKYSSIEIAELLGISLSAVEQAYCVAFDLLERGSDEIRWNAGVAVESPHAAD